MLFYPLCALLMACVVWQLLPDRTALVADQIVKAIKFRRETMALEDIHRIRFHYHAVVGFISVWEFVASDGRALNLSGTTIGLNRMLRSLEHYLPGFSLGELKRLFDAGDAEDTIEVWQRAS